MPPDPVLGLLAIVALILYGVIGGLVTAVTMKVMDKDGHDLRKLALNQKDEYVAGGYVWAGILWPAWLTLVAVGAILFGACFAVFAAPVLLGEKVSRYAGNALLKETPDAA